MSGTGKISTHHVPDDGTWYVTGDTVRVDRGPVHPEIIKDANGDYEIFGCRQATEYAGTPLLRVSVRRVSV